MAPNENAFDDQPTDHDISIADDVPAAEPAAPPAIEVEVVTERGPMKKGGRWRMLEIWTKNRVYSVDAAMNCIEVINRASGRPDEDHPLLGGRLAGGQRKEGQRMKLAHPYPVPGTEAVFKLPPGRTGRFGQTSKVERVVLRVRLADVPLLDSQPLWEDLAARFSSLPPPGPERNGR
jgi:hypothetical protein